MPIDKYAACETKAQISFSPVTVTTNATLASLFGTTNYIHGYFKNITITPPEMEVEKIDLIGVDSDGFQSALLNEKPATMATLTGTLILDGNNWRDLSKHLEEAVAPPTTVTSGGATYKRYQFGQLCPTTSRPRVAVLVQLRKPMCSGETAVSETNYLFNNARITKLGDYKLGGPEDNWEVDITVTCLPKDWYVEKMVVTS